MYCVSITSENIWLPIAETIGRRREGEIYEERDGHRERERERQIERDSEKRQSSMFLSNASLVDIK